MRDLRLYHTEQPEAMGGGAVPLKPLSIKASGGGGGGSEHDLSPSWSCITQHPALKRGLQQHTVIENIRVTSTEQNLFSIKGRMYGGEITV